MIYLPGVSRGQVRHFSFSMYRTCFQKEGFFSHGMIYFSASVFIGHPFDTIKVRMQTSSAVNVSFSSRSLFKGMAAPLVAASAVNAVIFGTYASTGRILDDYYYREKNESFGKNFICGAFAGFVQCLIICPTEHVKCRIQTSAHSLYTNPWKLSVDIFRKHGFDGLFRGFWATSLREVPAFGLYFAGYDYMRDHIVNFLERNGYASLSGPWAASAISGGISGCVTWAGVYPIDVIKTRIQTGPLDARRGHVSRRMLSVGMQICNEVGVKGMFRGLSVTMIRAFPVNG